MKKFVEYLEELKIKRIEEETKRDSLIKTDEEKLEEDFICIKKDIDDIIARAYNGWRYYYDIQKIISSHMFLTDIHKLRNALIENGYECSKIEIEYFEDKTPYNVFYINLITLMGNHSKYINRKYTQMLYKFDLSKYIGNEDDI